MFKYINFILILFILVGCSQEKEESYDAVYTVEVLLYDYDRPVGKATLTQYAHYKNDSIKYSRITLSVKNIYNLPTTYNFKITSYDASYIGSVSFLNYNSTIDFGTIIRDSTIPITVQGFQGIIFSDVKYGWYNG